MTSTPLVSMGSLMGAGVSDLPVFRLTAIDFVCLPAKCSAGYTISIPNRGWGLISLRMAYLLAIEATGAVCGVALVDDGALAGAARLAHGLNLSGSLLHAAEWLLARRGLSLAQVDAFAVDVGPGAFTGLKIGAMLAKSWAHALGKPLVAVSAFEACAAQMPAGAPTLVALPARRDALYLQWLLPADAGSAPATGRACVRRARDARRVASA
jgi:tRNA threonylcarbamoyl adenosine modification protein YeaZ